MQSRGCYLSLVSDDDLVDINPQTIVTLDTDVFSLHQLYHKLKSKHVSTLISIPIIFNPNDTNKHQLAILKRSHIHPHVSVRLNKRISENSHTAQHLLHYCVEGGMIRKLNFSYIALDFPSYISINEALEHNVELQQLSFNRCQMEDEALIALTRGLSKNTHLISLDLSGNSLTADAVVEFAGALQHNQTLTHLNLSYNPIMDSGLSAIATAINDNHAIKLTSLNLRQCELSNVGIKHLVRSLAVRFIVPMVDLNISNNHIDKNGIKYLLPLIGEDGCVRKLNLSGNFLDPEALHVLFSGLQQKTSLRELHLYSQHLTNNDVKQLISYALSNTRITHIIIDQTNIDADLIKQLNLTLAANHTPQHSLASTYGLGLIGDTLKNIGKINRKRTLSHSSSYVSSDDEDKPQPNTPGDDFLPTLSR